PAKPGCDQLTPVAALVPLVCLVFGSFVLGGHNFAISRVNLNLLNARVTAPRDVERVNQSAALLLQLSGHHTQALSADARQRLLLCGGTSDFCLPLQLRSCLLARTTTGRQEQRCAHQKTDHEGESSGRVTAALRVRRSLR